MDLLRKTVKLDQMTDVITLQYKKIGGLKKSADEQEQELEAERKLAEHSKKVKVLTNNRVEFSKYKAFKR